MVLSSISPPFGRLFRSLGQIAHVLLTRAPLYSPPEGGFLARLACVKHAASVRSEPGSNSPIESWSGCPFVDTLNPVCQSDLQRPTARDAYRSPRRTPSGSQSNCVFRTSASSQACYSDFKEQPLLQSAVLQRGFLLQLGARCQLLFSPPPGSAFKPSCSTARRRACFLAMTTAAVYCSTAERAFTHFGLRRQLLFLPPARLSLRAVLLNRPPSRLLPEGVRCCLLLNRGSGFYSLPTSDVNPLLAPSAQPALGPSCSSAGLQGFLPEGPPCLSTAQQTGGFPLARAGHVNSGSRGGLLPFTDPSFRAIDRASRRLTHAETLAQATRTPDRPRTR